MIRTRDNRLLATSYGTREGDKNYHLDLIESTDDGKSWHFLSTIVDDKEARYPEGPCESTLVELADGTILTIYRVAGNMPSQQCRSTDGGKSWSAPEPSVDFGASPHACLLSDGTLAVVTGRPGLFLFLDFTGTGREYQRYQIYNNSTSSYASVFESAPGVLSVVYDESNFGSSRGPSPFARIVMASFKVEKGDFKLASGDPRAEKADGPAQRLRAEARPHSPRDDDEKRDQPERSAIVDALGADARHGTERQGAFGGSVA